ncbi:monovalent cation/H+ antiporter subunit A [Thiorhodovibrio frisius]|uniref:NADH:ubiquinone oxidoreductase subunit 5 (Chain L)/multisubunit Na+/H+ antiporter, MnhA subunit n=1 Tax=Thiorhodovibrio frisius TaxID=631362 RepID=H8YX45_9GAMM|nr:monovalent cation/H+ antiporter subunit A [Thiorhodovibrio frisius]EIC23021.1 NADH:ubiquinone oxidoreductase subunit 5 (chain L)/multisubunit Na+/H+ antiporter, MnhA subunit [Thiorhodovibrio frisius]WPL22714.1 Multiple resistance and pH homeostasis protein A [Thiorhodovibrio frisius]
MFLAWIVLIPFIGALLPPFAVWLAPKPSCGAAAAFAAALVSSAALIIALNHTPDVFAGGEVHVAIPWIPQIGLTLALRFDGLAMVFVLLILGIGLLVILYARFYLVKSDQVARFFSILLLFQGAMLGIVLSDNLLLLVVFWELTSLTSFLLVGFDPRSIEARRGALMALVITAGGGLCLLAGFLLLGSVAGSFALSEVLAAGEQVHQHPLYLPILILILLGAFTKSAQFPFHFWLPSAMSAPTPVSAYLHSATMVKAGIFLLARFFPVFAETDVWFYLVGGVGLTTFLLGAYFAIFKHDIKGLLAYSTISHLGLITFLFGLGTPLGAVAGLFHAMNHAVFKASLFMAAGIIDHETGTRDMRRLSGLWHFMPITGTLAMVAAAAMAGVPLLNGFLSKEMFFAETVHHDWLGHLDWLLPVAATAGGIFAVAYSVRFIHDVFFGGPPRYLDHAPHEPARWMRIPVEILVALCLVVGIFPEQTVRPLLDIGVRSMLGFEPKYDLAIWHGFSFPLLMSFIALIGGMLLYRMRGWLFNLHDKLFPPTSAASAFQRIAAGMQRFARARMQRPARASLQGSIAWLLATALVVAILPVVPALMGIKLGALLELLGTFKLSPVDLPSIGGAVILAVALAGVVGLRRQRLQATILIGVIGLVLSLAFVHFSAPDLALTQLSVEVVTTILLLLVLYFLPQADIARLSRWRRTRDLLLAVAAGSGAAALSFAIMSADSPKIAGYFLEASKPAAGAGNVVNGILVDFRGFDTLGEITVLAIAAAGIFAMLRGIRLRTPPRDLLGHTWSPDAHPVILAMLSRPLLPMALLVAVFMLLRGHHEPGGGFIAGLIASIALILQQLASGQQWSAERLRLNYTRLIGAGLILSLGTGLAALVFGRPFLTSAFWHGELPLIGELEFASAMAFDAGVFLVVLGTVMLILDNLGRLSGHRQRGKRARRQGPDGIDQGSKAKAPVIAPAIAPAISPAIAPSRGVPWKP